MKMQIELKLEYYFFSELLHKVASTWIYIDFYIKKIPNMAISCDDNHKTILRMDVSQI